MATIKNIIANNCDLNEVINYLLDLNYFDKDSIAQFLILDGPDIINDLLKKYLNNNQNNEIMKLIDELSKIPCQNRNEIVEYYLNNFRGKFSTSTLLYQAVIRNNIELIKSLLEYPGTDINKCYSSYEVVNKSNNHSTMRKIVSPLYRAVERQNLPMLKLILSHKNINLSEGYYCWYEKNGQNKKVITITPLQCAIKQKNMHIIMELLERGAGLFEQKININKFVKLNLDLTNIIVTGFRSSKLKKHITQKKKGFEKAITSSTDLKTYLLTNPEIKYLDILVANLNHAIRNKSCIQELSAMKKLIAEYIIKKIEN